MQSVNVSICIPHVAHSCSRARARSLAIAVVSVLSLRITASLRVLSCELVFTSQPQNIGKKRAEVRKVPCKDKASYVRLGAKWRVSNAYATVYICICMYIYICILYIYMYIYNYIKQ